MTNVPSLTVPPPIKISFLQIILPWGRKPGRLGGCPRVHAPRRDMTNKLRADSVSKTYWSLLCRVGSPSAPPQRGLASQAALGASGSVHLSLDRSASSGDHHLGCLMRGDGICPLPSWAPGLPSQGGPRFVPHEARVISGTRA